MGKNPLYIPPTVKAGFAGVSLKENEIADKSK
jgi:hypothetical protein